MVDHTNDQSTGVQSQEGLLHDVDPSLTEANEVAKALDVDTNTGLSSAEAQRRLEKFGPNQLASAPPVPKWKKFLAQFQDPLVYLLLAATVISLIAWFIERSHGTAGEVLPFDAIVIILILIVNAVLGYIQEARAEQAVEALAQMTAPQTSVLRDGKIVHINTADVVPGDIVVLGEGDTVSADGRLFAAASLRIAEASLTGESVPVGKKPDTLDSAKALGDRTNMIFNGTSVTQGTGRAIVTGTGMNTQVGKIADMLSQTDDEDTPLQKEMTHVSKILGIAVCIIAAVVLVALFITQGFHKMPDDLIDSLLLAVSLAVAAVPEGLATILTVVLALGVQRMAKHNAIVKKLSSVETLGSASVICSDKTGTLTRNEMTVERIVTPSGEVQLTGTGYEPKGKMLGMGGDAIEESAPVNAEALRTIAVGAFANDGDLRQNDAGQWEIVGDPTEVSLVVASRKIKADRALGKLDRVAEVPFTSERKRMAVIGKDSSDNGNLSVYAKGAPDVLLGYCTRIAVGDAVRPMTEGDRQEILATVERLSGEAYRTLGEAYRPLGTTSLADIPGIKTNAAGQVTDISEQSDVIERDLIWAGMVGIIDPPRTEVRDSVAEAHRAGIRTVMITGDHPLTAARIASDLGIIEKGGKALTGDQLDAMPDEAAFDKATSEVSVYARVAPEHKLKIVESLQRQGNIAAMTGDGVNDAPAVKSADIGVAMGITGTEVTKEAATLVLTDDNFSSIVRAVEEGRTLYENIIKFVRFQLSTNIGAILTVLAAPFLGFATPFTAIQILWVNIIMDGPPAMTLGVEPGRAGIMDEPPRSKTAAILSAQRLWRVGLYGVTMAVGTLAAYAWALQGGDATRAGTLAFTTFVLFQFFNIFNARAEHGSAFNAQFFSNGKLWLSLAGVLGLQVVAVHWPPAQAIFDTVDLSLLEWSVAIAIASTTLVLDEARKLLMCLFRRVSRG